MLERRFGRWAPGFLLRRLKGPETRIERAVAAFAAGLAPGAPTLDAGAGELRYRAAFERQRYVATDLAVGDATWDYSRLDALADLSALPFRDESFDAAINVVVLEHVRDPGGVLCEISRVLRPGGRLLVVAPQQWEVHQAPHDYFRFTRYGLRLLLERAGFDAVEMEPMGGYFTLLARRAVNSLNYFQGGWRWLLFPPAAAAACVLALTLPLLDGLDREKDFTLGYICVASKSSR